MNAAMAILVAIVVMVMAIGSGFDLLYRVAYPIIALVMMSYLWARKGVDGLGIDHRLKTKRAQVGENAEETIQVYNSSRLPKLWLKADCYSTLPGYQASRVINIRPRGISSWSISTLCWKRGKYLMGPVALASSDPLGLFRRRLVTHESQELLVYPAMVELGDFGLSAWDLPSSTKARRRAYYVTPNVLTIRDYLPGDSLNRIHWLSTAKAGHLMSKEFEPDPAADLWIVLDMEEKAQAGDGLESTEEYGVTAAASLARHFLKSGREVGLVAYGEPPVRVPSDRGLHQMTRILEELAVVRALGTTPLAQVITAESFRFSRNSAVIIITPAMGDNWVAAARQLRERGVQCLAILLEAATFGGTGSALMMVGGLAAADIPTYLMKKGERLDQVLTSARPFSARTGLTYRPG